MDRNPENLGLNLILMFCALYFLPANSGVVGRRKWQLTPVFLPGESQGRVGCRPWGRTESDVTEAT